MLSVLYELYHAITDEVFGMKSKARVVEIFSAAVALFSPMNLTWGQSCQCDNTPAAGPQRLAGFHDYAVPSRSFTAPLTAGEQASLNYKSGRQLPAGWPNQWGAPAFLDDVGQVAKNEATKPATPGVEFKTLQNDDRKGKAADEKAESAQKQTATSGLLSSLMVRDPFSGRMIPTNSQVRWAHGEETKAAAGGIASGAQKAAVGQNEGEAQRSTGISSGTDHEGMEANTGISARASKETIGGPDSSIDPSSRASTRLSSVLPTPGRAAGGPAIGGTGGIGGGGGVAKAGIGGGNGGGGIGGNGLSWNPETGGAGGAAGGNGGGQARTGVLDYTDTIDEKTNPPVDNTADNPVDPRTNSPGEDAVDPPPDGPGADPVASPPDGSGDNLADIPLPDPSIPDVTPDVPTGDNPSHYGEVHNTRPGNGDSPVVPEPGSIILLGIAGGVGGAGLIRHRSKKMQADGK